MSRMVKYVYTCGRSVNIVTKRKVLMHNVGVFDRISDLFEICYKCVCPESTLCRFMDDKRWKVYSKTCSVKECSNNFDSIISTTFALTILSKFIVVHVFPSSNVDVLS